MTTADMIEDALVATFEKENLQHLPLEFTVRLPWHAFDDGSLRIPVVFGGYTVHAEPDEEGCLTCFH